MPEIAFHSVTLHTAGLVWKDLPPMFKNVTNTRLKVTERVGNGWRIGSLWDVMPTKDNSTWVPTEVDSHSRFAYCEIGGMVTYLITSFVSDDVLGFFKAEELDGGIVKTAFGQVNRHNGKILQSWTQVCYKYCSFCIARNAACNCSHSMLKRYFDDQRTAWKHESRGSQIWGGTTGPEYARLCFGGRKAFRKNGELGITTDTTFITAENITRKSMTHIIQLALEQLLAPTRGLRIMEDDLMQRTISSSSSLSLIEHSTEDMSRTVSVPHRESRSEVEKYSCPICGTSLTRKHDIQRHIRGVHEKRRAHYCNICSRSFLQRGHLNDHIRQCHDPDAAHICSNCGKRFGCASKLIRHMRKHTGERIPCTQCEKSFADESSLKYHVVKKHS